MSLDLSLKCYSDKTAAQLLGCSRRHVGNLRAAGLLPFVTFGRKVVIRHEDLLALIERNRRGGWAIAEEHDAA